MMVTLVALTWLLWHRICRKRCWCYRKMRRRMGILRLRKVKFLVYSRRRIYCDCAQHRTIGAAPTRSKQSVVMWLTQNTARYFIPL